MLKKARLWSPMLNDKMSDLVFTTESMLEGAVLLNVA